MADNTKVNVNLILEAQEDELQEEAIDQCFFTSLTTDAALRTDESEEVVDGVVERKTETLEHGAISIKFSAFRQLVGEGTFEDQVLVGRGEEKLSQVESEAFFSEVNHAVPYDLKGLQRHYHKAYDLITKPRKALSTWNGQYQESIAWQALFRRHNNRVTAVHGSKALQRWHPNIFTAESAGLTKVQWSANVATHQTAIAAAIANLGSGDVFNVDRVYQMGIAADDEHLRPVKVTIDGNTHYKFIWAYPRAERFRIKKAFEAFWLSGDVRGPGNKAFSGDIFSVDRFLFIEASRIPQINRVDANTVSLLEAWAPNTTTRKRGNQRTAGYHTHAILGANALCFAEPDPLQFVPVDNIDANRKGLLATYRMLGYCRGTEWYDDMLNPTEVLSQGSLFMLANAA